MYIWMRENHEALSQAFKRDGPHWVARTEAIRQAGLTDQSGKPPTMRTAQKTWYNLCRDLRNEGEAEMARRSESAPVLASAVPPEPITADPHVMPADDNPYGFRPAGGVKKWTKKESDHE